jgi:hypothetical protein
MVVKKSMTAVDFSDFTEDSEGEEEGN